MKHEWSLGDELVLRGVKYRVVRVFDDGSIRLYKLGEVSDGEAREVVLRYAPDTDKEDDAIEEE